MLNNIIELLLVHFGMDRQANDLLAERFGEGQLQVAQIEFAEHVLAVCRNRVVDHARYASRLQVCLQRCTAVARELKGILMKNMPRV